MAVLGRIERIKDSEVSGLLLSGILTTADLLRLGQTAQAREVIAARSGISQRRLLRLVHLADLLRIDGVGWEFAVLLEQLGVHSVSSLADHDPAELAAKLETLSRPEGKPRRLPTASQLEDWVRQAKELPPQIQY